VNILLCYNFTRIVLSAQVVLRSVKTAGRIRNIILANFYVPRPGQAGF